MLLILAYRSKRKRQLNSFHRNTILLMHRIFFAIVIMKIQGCSLKAEFLGWRYNSRISLPFFEHIRRYPNSQLFPNKKRAKDIPLRVVCDVQVYFSFKPS